ncbi:MAG TPA: Pvc16 family protein [Pseudonocardiaceae bacterium]|jgi:hypothetical protein
MSGGWAIESITAALRDLVESGLKEVEDQAVAIVGPPDRDGESPFGRVTVFLYQVGPDDCRSGDTGYAREALPLVLRYLLIPDAAGDELAVHRLLGAALWALQDHPLQADEQEQLSATPRAMDVVGMRALWSMFGLPYRLSTAVEVRGVRLDRPPRPDRGAAGDPDPPEPALLGAAGPRGRSAAQLGDLVQLHGRHLRRPVTVRLAHRLLPRPVELPAGAADTDPDTVRFTLPDTPPDLPAGVWLVSLLCLDGQPVTSNDVALAVAPRITTAMPMVVARDRAGTAVVRIDCEPAVRPGQLAFLLLGDLPVPAEPGGGGTVEFRILHARPRTYAVRLRIDGVDSLGLGPDEPGAGHLITVT